ncbi:MAG TPA: hypothetical protein VHJ82_02250 [Actinomycetota bacterium]|nr:hypothetical protein [Actinomycetota bacterium]
MRRTVVLLLVGGLLLGAGLTPASAKKKRKVTEEYSFTAPIPNPNPTDCNVMGVEDLQYQTAAFSTPGKGVLDVVLENFQVDWDLFVMDADGNVIGSSTSDNSAAATERVVLPIPGKQDLTILACNWSGGPTATATLTYTY